MPRYHGQIDHQAISKAVRAGLSRRSPLSSERDECQFLKAEIRDTWRVHSEETRSMLTAMGRIPELEREIAQLRKNKPHLLSSIPVPDFNDKGKKGPKAKLYEAIIDGITELLTMQEYKRELSKWRGKIDALQAKLKQVEKDFKRHGDNIKIMEGQAAELNARRRRLGCIT